MYRYETWTPEEKRSLWSAPSRELAKEDWEARIASCILVIIPELELPTAYANAQTLFNEGVYLNYLSGDYGEYIYLPKDLRD